MPKDYGEILINFKKLCHNLKNSEDWFKIQHCSCEFVKSDIYVIELNLGEQNHRNLCYEIRIKKKSNVICPLLAKKMNQHVIHLESYLTQNGEIPKWCGWMVLVCLVLGVLGFFYTFWTSILFDDFIFCDLCIAELCKSYCCLFGERSMLLYIIQFYMYLGGSIHLSWYIHIDNLKYSVWL